MPAENPHVLIEQQLAPLCGKTHCLLTANATTGICLALRAAGIQDRMVGIPDGVCMNVPLAVIFSGNTPVYLDIDPATLGLSPAILSGVRTPLAAVVAVHAYGYPCDIRGIVRWCREHSVFLIEDVASAQGARVGSSPAGMFGDVSVFSFGAGKIIDAGGGGAVLTDDPVLLNEISRLERELPDGGSLAKLNLDEFSRYHTRLYNEHYGIDLNEHAAECRTRALALRDSFIIRRARADAFAECVMAGLKSFDENLLRRAANAAALTDRFSAGANGIVPFAAPSGSAVWRFNLIVEHERNRLLRHLLDKGFKVSSWFPSVDLFLEKREPEASHTPVSDRVSDTILNLWVNHEANPGYFQEISREILEFFQTD